MLATLTQLKTRIGIETTDTSSDTELTEILTSVGREFEIYCHREFELADRVDYFTGCSNQLKLKSWPVCSISEIKIATDYDFDSADELTANDDYRLTNKGENGIVYRIGCRWSNVPDSIKITYTAGYVAAGTIAQEGQTSVPSDLTEAAIEHASLIWKRKDTIATKSENFDGATTSYEPVKLSDKTKAILDNYKRHCL